MRFPDDLLHSCITASARAQAADCTCPQANAAAYTADDWLVLGRPGNASCGVHRGGGGVLSALITLRDVHLEGPRVSFLLQEQRGNAA